MWGEKLRIEGVVVTLPWYIWKWFVRQCTLTWYFSCPYMFFEKYCKTENAFWREWIFCKALIDRHVRTYRGSGQHNLDTWLNSHEWPKGGAKLQHQEFDWGHARTPRSCSWCLSLVPPLSPLTWLFSQESKFHTFLLRWSKSHSARKKVVELVYSLNSQSRKTI